MAHWTVDENIISVDFGAKHRQSLEQQALEIMNVALMGEPGICGMEPVIYVDVPPDKEPA